MGRLMQGVILIMTVIVLRIFVPLIAIDAAIGSQTSVPGCSTTDNQTQCENVGKTAFFSFLLSIIAPTIPGAPLLFNIFYFLIVQGMLISGALLIVLAFVPLTAS